MISAQHITAALMVNPVLTVVLIVLFVAVMIGLNSRGRETASRRRHRRHQATATRVLARLPLLGGDGQRLAYLRKINPYVFEELLLLAFERQGMQLSAIPPTAATVAWTVRSLSKARPTSSRPSVTAGRSHRPISRVLVRCCEITIVTVFSFIPAVPVN